MRQRAAVLFSIRARLEKQSDRAAGLVVWLNPAWTTLVARMTPRGKLDRPMFRDEAAAFDLYRSRLAAYRRADLTVYVGPGETAEETAARLELEVRRRA